MGKKNFLSLFSNPVKLTTKDGMNVQNTQISKIWEIDGDYSDSMPFCVKNISDENISVSVRLVGMEKFVETVFYPGWNVELVCEVKNAPSGIIQGGRL